MKKSLQVGLDLLGPSRPMQHGRVMTKTVKKCGGYIKS